MPRTGARPEWILVVPSLIGRFDPASVNQAAIFEPVKQRIQRGDVEAQHAASEADPRAGRVSVVQRCLSSIPGPGSYPYMSLPNISTRASARDFTCGTIFYGRAQDGASSAYRGQRLVAAPAFESTF